MKLRQLSLILTVLTLALVIGTPVAAADMNWGGSLETGPEFTDGNGAIIYDNDFRLKMNLSSGESLAGTLQLRYQAALPVSAGPAGAADLTVNQAYLDLKMPAAAMLRIGRQKISWGSGMAWNPTNYLGADKNRTDLSNEFPGVDVLDLEKGFGEAQFTVLIKPQGAPEDWGKAAKFATRLGRQDLTFSLYQQGTANGFGIDWAASIGSFTVYAEVAARTDADRYYIGASGGQGVPLTRSDAARFIHGVAGLNRIFPGDWMMQLEYYYNQAGWDPAEAANYYRYQGPAAFQAASYCGDLRRNYLYALVRKGELVDDLAATVTVLANWDDGSAMLMPGLEYRLGENTVANLTLTWFTGSPQSEFGALPDRLQIAVKFTVSF